MKIKFEIIIYWSGDDDSFIAEAPELAGCMADGSSYEEALRNIKKNINDWIEVANELDRDVPEPKGRQSNVQ